MVLALETRKFHCRGCGRYFWQRFPGILPRKRSTEPFRRYVCLKTTTESRAVLVPWQPAPSPGPQPPRPPHSRQGNRVGPLGPRRRAGATRGACGRRPPGRFPEP